MRKTLLLFVTAITVLLCMNTLAYANGGWETTDDPTPYYYQQWGKWYNCDENKVFMVQMNDKTYKYIFDRNGNLLDGWVTYMPMHLP